MFQSLSIFQSAGGLARHASARQSVIARNVANIDTPGYRAQQVEPFRLPDSAVSTQVRAEGLRTSRINHIQGTGTANSTNIRTLPGEQKPNENTVSLEDQTLQAIEAERAHSRALAVYQTSLTILKTSLGRGR